MNSIIIEALPNRYTDGNVTVATANSFSKMRFENAQGTLEDESTFIANTYNNDYITYNANVTYPTETWYSIEVKGNADITYKETESHYSIGSLKFDYMPPSEEGSSIRIKNVQAEKVFKFNEDISNDESEINRLLSFVTGLSGDSKGVTTVEYKITAEQEITFTELKNNGYKVTGSVISKESRIDTIEEYNYISNFTFEKETEKHTLSYDISHKAETTEDGRNRRYFDTVISNIKFDNENIELSNLIDATITRMKDFVGDQEM